MGVNARQSQPGVREIDARGVQKRLQAERIERGDESAAAEIGENQAQRAVGQRAGVPEIASHRARRAVGSENPQAVGAGNRLQRRRIGHERDLDAAGLLQVAPDAFVAPLEFFLERAQAQLGLHARQKNLDIYGLGHVIIRAGSQAFDDVARFAFGGDENDGKFACGGRAADFA